MEVFVCESERIDDLQRGGLRLIAKRDSFRFGTDAVLLADFASMKKGARVADLGTGSGVLPFLIGARVEGTTFDAVEIQEDICDMARRSVLMNGWEERVSVHCMNLKDAPAVLGHEKFDAVVSNPPYGKLGEGMLPPKRSDAIARFEVECSLEDVVRTAFQLLKNGGSFYMVHQMRRLLEILDVTRANNLAPKRLRCLYPKATSEGKLVLIECIKNGKCALRWLPPLIQYGEDGEFTPEARRIYGMGQDDEDRNFGRNI
ncbi:MAG: tRNA1(Val) (adenine(37)-N6)-methyltransferase [Christensenellales bacterium]|jgi:tRNA1Val (adenine37-N6)-methyltransferase